MDVSRRIIPMVFGLIAVFYLGCYAGEGKPTQKSPAGKPREEGKEEKKKDDIFAETEKGRGGPPGPGGPRFDGRGGPRFFELSEETIKQVMDALAKRDPEKAKELSKLREKDPEQFKAELRMHGREELGKIFREQMETWRKRWEAEYIAWLEKNYPQEAEEVKKNKDKDQGLYTKRMQLSMERYGEIYWASRDNPELEAILKADLELKNKKDELLKKIKSAKEEETKKNLITELQKVVSDRFDVIVRRKELEYERLLRRLEELKKQVEENKEEINKWKDPTFRKGNVEKHVEDLIKGLPKFKWD